jgi:hypothetical protein
LLKLFDKDADLQAMPVSERDEILRELQLAAQSEEFPMVYDRLSGTCSSARHAIAWKPLLSLIERAEEDNEAGSLPLPLAIEIFEQATQLTDSVGASVGETSTRQLRPRIGRKRAGEPTLDGRRQKKACFEPSNLRSRGGSS